MGPGSGLDSSASGLGRITDSCEHDHEFSSSIRDEGSLVQLRGSRFLKQVSATYT
jgi:hypothetical protein